MNFVALLVAAAANGARIERAANRIRARSGRASRACVITDPNDLVAREGGGGDNPETNPVSQVGETLEERFDKLKLLAEKVSDKKKAQDAPTPKRRNSM